MRCLACGSENLAEGAMVGGDERPLSFVFTGRGWWRKIFGIGNRAVCTYACVHCGNIQHHVELTDQDRERLASYDGPRPSIVDDPTEAGR